MLKNVGSYIQRIFSSIILNYQTLLTPKFYSMIPENHVWILDVENGSYCINL